jgi:hypothetical protein
LSFLAMPNADIVVRIGPFHALPINTPQEGKGGASPTKVVAATPAALQYVNLRPCGH